MAKNLDPAEFARKLADSVQKVLLAQQQAVDEGMLDLISDMRDRIFLNGKDSDDQAIGRYSTKPYYASLNQTSQVRSSSLKGRGKNDSKSKFQNGKPRKSMYLPGGYAEFRNVVGRQSERVDLNLTGSLQKDIRLGTSQGISQVAFTTDDKLEIAKGNEKRFGKTIFSASEAELSKLVQRWEDDVTYAFFSSFK